MTRLLALCLTPLALAVAVTLPSSPRPLGVSNAAPVEPPAPSTTELRRRVAEALAAAIPAAGANGLQVDTLDHRPTGIGDWHRITGTARVGRDNAAAGLRFAARSTTDGARVEGLRVNWLRPRDAALSTPAREAIEAATRAALRTEFPEQAPRVALLSLARHRSGHDGARAAEEPRVFRGRGRIDFGDEGEVIAPIEVVLDADARVVALRYSLDELDPVPFDDACSAVTDQPLVAAR